MDVFTNYYRLHKNPDMKSRNLMKYFLGSIDVLAILLAFQASYLVNYFEKKDFFFTDKDILLLFIMILPFWLLVQYLVRITGIQTKRYKVLSLLYLQSSIAVFYLLIIIYFFFRLYSLDCIVFNNKPPFNRKKGSLNVIFLSELGSFSGK